MSVNIIITQTHKKQIPSILPENCNKLPTVLYNYNDHTSHFYRQSDGSTALGQAVTVLNAGKDR